MKKHRLCVMALCVILSAPASAQIQPVAGFELGLGYGGHFGLEPGIYPALGLAAEPGDLGFLLSAHAGAAWSLADRTFRYQFGGTLDVSWSGWLIGAGGGIADFTRTFSPFIRGEIGIGSIDAAIKACYDYGVEDNGYKISVLIACAFPFGKSTSAPVRPQKPRENPTITPEELRKVELAYAQTVQEIKRRGRNLYINNAYERAAFIQRWQGTPNTRAANAARNEKLPFFYSGSTSEKDIVGTAQNEPDAFRKVRIIHDWVADIFAYDNDLLWWMDNVSGQNAEFTLGQILRRERGVCYEYAILFWFLADAAGIETYLISDFSQPGIGHAYNMVVIGGTGYVIDATWDSGNRYENGRITQFRKTVKKDFFMPGVSQSYRLRGW